MKNMIKIVLAALIILAMSASTLNAKVNKGQKLYLKKLKKACNMNGAKMATKHSQGEWSAINKAGKMADEIKTLCPGISDKAVKPKYLQHYYDFMHEYANDSGNVPSC